MDNYLTMLYAEWFKICEYEKKLMAIHDFDSEMGNVRNDQSISETRKFNEIIKHLINKYMECLK